jgi:glycosyltransferase involved in cell wall biosynthesis
VITSNTSSMPEVAGDAAFLVDPESPAEIARAMGCLATDTNFSNLLRHRGRARAEDFRWDTTAASVASIYRRLGKQTGAVNPASAAPTSTLTRAA